MAFADRHRFIIGPGRCLDMLGDDRRAVDDRGHHHARRIPAIAVTIAIVLIEAARVRAPRIGAAIILAAARPPLLTCPAIRLARSEEHTSELQSLMRSSYAVFCLKKKKIITYQ